MFEREKRNQAAALLDWDGRKIQRGHVPKRSEELQRSADRRAVLLKPCRSRLSPVLQRFDLRLEMLKVAAQRLCAQVPLPILSVLTKQADDRPHAIKG